MSKLIITRGLPGSGKTTHAEEWVLQDPARRVRINRDALRAMIHFDQRNSVHETEVAITKASRDLARTYLRNGFDVIVDDTNLRQRHAREWATLAKIVGAEFEVKDFTSVPLETILKQNQQRPADKIVPEKVIREMHTKFLNGRPLPHPEADMPAVEEWEQWEPTPGFRSVYLVDIDGTVAICGERDIYDGSKAILDTVNTQVADVIDKLDREVIFMTGRSAEHREVTEKWLAINGFGSPKVFMRPSGDKRKDSTVKHELFNEHIRGNYNVAGVFDDRKQVVDMWRAIGLTVFQVAEGNF